MNIYENNKNMNEMIKKGLINKNKKNNLLIILNNIEKSIINHNKYYNDSIFYTFLSILYHFLYKKYVYL